MGYGVFSSKSPHRLYSEWRAHHDFRGFESPSRALPVSVETRILVIIIACGDSTDSRRPHPPRYDRSRSTSNDPFNACWNDGLANCAGDGDYSPPPTRSRSKRDKARRQRDEDDVTWVAYTWLNTPARRHQLGERAVRWFAPPHEECWCAAYFLLTSLGTVRVFLWLLCMYECRGSFLQSLYNVVWLYCLWCTTACQR